MNLELNDKVALVTGASKGIGQATAICLAQEGADVVVCYHHDSHGAQRCSEAIASLGRRSWLCPLDIADPASVASAINELSGSIGGLDILVLCAGENIVTPFDELTPEEWQRIVNVNLNAAFFVLKAARPLLREGASVVTVASVAAHTGAPHHAHYAAAKAGLINLTKSAARALAPRIRVNCVAPGITLTPMGEETIDSLPQNYAQEKLLTQRYATPEEIARTIVFVASPASSFTTGATIDVNGGRELR